MTTPSPQPGWFPDPSGTGQRYFDGTQWTEHRAAAPTATWSPPPPPTPASNGIPPIGRVVIGILGVLALLYIMGTACGKDDKTSSSSSSPTRSSATVSSSLFVAPPPPTPPTPPTPAGPVAPQGVVFHTEPGSGGDNVFAEFHITDGLFMALTKTMARQQTIEILRYAHETYPDARQVTVQGMFSTKDAYGNSDPNTIVLNVSYLKSTIDKINFDGMDSDRIWEIRDSGMVHPELQG
jgi:hypothetical protein